MVTAHRQIEAVRVWIPTALNLAHTAPVDVRRISVLLVAGHDAALATDALLHVEMKTVLLAGAGSPLRNSGCYRQRLDFVQTPVGVLRPLLAQDESDAVVFCSFNER
jgi:hypothetical protein